jgi:hypothetical protein
MLTSRQKNKVNASNPSPLLIRHQHKVYKTNTSLYWFQSEGAKLISAPPSSKPNVLCDGDFYLHLSPKGNQVWRWEKSLAGGFRWKEVALHREQEIIQGVRYVIVITSRRTLSAVKSSTFKRHHQKYAFNIGDDQP